MSNLQTIILALSLIVAGLLVGGIYEIETSGNGIIGYKVNRFTGSISICTLNQKTWECEIRSGR
jgi:hypothetical protein